MTDQMVEILSNDLDLSCKLLRRSQRCTLPYANHRKIDMLTPTLYWPMIESSLGIIGACLPLMRPVLQKISPQVVFRSLRSMFEFSAFGSDDSLKTIEAKTTLEVACSPTSMKAFAPNRPRDSNEWEDP